jgi:2-dehydro-3-deoxy-D-arabinonate dehydratase
MQYYQFEADGTRRLAVRTDGQMYDLRSARPRLRTLGDLLRAASISDTPVDTIADRLRSNADTIDDPDVGVPLDAQEVWAAGVTYQISEEARESESGMPEMYLDVYDADRPELFFKATPSRTVGPGEAVGIRADAEWSVPEPELGVVLHEGEIVGYTIGNDMSSRDIEGENPLYLPQAKVYDRCCSLGPCVRSADSLDDPHDLEMWMTIERAGRVVFEDATTTGKMARSVEELVDYYTRHNAVPERVVLLTGTSLVPEDDFTLQSGDVIEIGIEGIGVLRNAVVTV